MRFEIAIRKLNWNIKDFGIDFNRISLSYFFNNCSTLKSTLMSSSLQSSSSTKNAAVDLSNTNTEQKRNEDNATHAALTKTVTATDTQIQQAALNDARPKHRLP